MARKLMWMLVMFLVMAVMSLGASTTWAASKNEDTGRYVFQDYETMKPGLFVLDVKKRRYVDSGYAAYWGGLKAQEPAVVKAAADAAKRMGYVRTGLLYGLPPLGYGIEVGNARGVAWTAGDAWALEKGKNSPWGCAALAEFYSVPYSVRNMPAGPALTMVTSAFYGFNRRLDFFTGSGLNSSLLVNMAMLAYKGATFYLFLDTGSGVEVLARPWIHNYMVWDALTDIPANWLVDLAYYGKGVPYGDLFRYQTGNMPVSATGVDFGRQYRAMSKFGQLAFVRSASSTLARPEI